MTQTKIESLIETCLNVFIGFIISAMCWPFVAALFDLPYSLISNLGITTIFTVLSITRGYVVRRWFNQRLNAASARLAQKLQGTSA